MKTQIASCFSSSTYFGRSCDFSLVMIFNLGREFVSNIQEVADLLQSFREAPPRLRRDDSVCRKFGYSLFLKFVLFCCDRPDGFQRHSVGTSGSYLPSVCASGGSVLHANEVPTATPAGVNEL